jgi:hypothetical protein
MVINFFLINYFLNYKKIRIKTCDEKIRKLGEFGIGIIKKKKNKNKKKKKIKINKKK